MHKLIYFAVVGTLATSLFNKNIPDFGLRSISDQFINPAKAQVSRLQDESKKSIDSIEGEVTAVSDGDTLTLNSSYGNSVIRLFAIDAPEASCHGFSDSVCNEAGQADAKASKLYLRSLTLNKHAKVLLGQGMSHNRLVGTIIVDGKDINLEMVKAGHAWHYKYYAKNQSPDDKATYSSAEKNAQMLKIGVWEDSNPVAPWIFRQRSKQKEFY